VGQVAPAPAPAAVAVVEQVAVAVVEQVAVARVEQVAVARVEPVAVARVAWAVRHSRRLWTAGLPVAQARTAVEPGNLPRCWVPVFQGSSPWT
jgi:hypothetical protein